MTTSPKKQKMTESVSVSGEPDEKAVIALFPNASAPSADTENDALVAPPPKRSRRPDKKRARPKKAATSPLEEFSDDLFESTEGDDPPFEEEELVSLEEFETLATENSQEGMLTDEVRQIAAKLEGANDGKIPPAAKRQKVQRRRQIDPTTCERDYSSEEIEFMNALDEYKRSSGRMFPTCSEVLEVLRNLGYTKSNDLP